MDNYLLKHAIDNVWCSPSQDNQLIFKMRRVSKETGVINFIPFLERRINLPSKNIVYHVFNIGQLQPAFLGLLNKPADWINEDWQDFSYCISNLKLFCNIYNANGVEFPKSKAKYMMTREKTLLVALEQDLRIPIQYSSDSIFIRLYSNAYFESIRSKVDVENIQHNTYNILSNNDILNAQDQYNTYKQLNGYTYCYVNGLLVDRIDLISVPINSIVELIYDSSITRVVNFSIKDLDKFNSIKDSCYKYLLAYDSKDVGRIEFLDDTDVFIYYEEAGRYKGVYFNRNDIKNQRMVTHTDYSLNVDSVHYLAEKLNKFIKPDVTLDISSFSIQVRIRDAGYDRPLIKEHHRIFELFKLPYSSRIKAMVGVDSTVPEWRAEELENSDYCKVMGIENLYIDQYSVNKCYGYNAAASIVGNNIVLTKGNLGSRYSEVPYLYSENSTVYEYNENGYMTGYYYSSGPIYTCTGTDTKYTEFFYGKANDTPNVIFGTDNIPLSEIHSYRVYSCSLINNVPDEKWIDITGTFLYSVINNKLTWLSNTNDNHYLMVRFDSSILCYDITTVTTEGRLSLTLVEKENRNGNIQNYIMPVPMGDLDIFLNGKSLINGIDYIVKFPVVYIVSKAYLNQPAHTAEQKLHIRFSGFCSSKLEIDNNINTGFIEHGLLSNNNKFDLFDDKLLRVTIDGGIRHKSEVQMSENHSGVSILNTLNGMPYQIKDVIVPLKRFTGLDNRTYRDTSRSVDKKISDYLTARIPQPARDGISAISQRYPITSTFLSVISYDLANNTLDTSLFTKNGVSVSDNVLLEIAKPYEKYLAFDLCYQSQALDKRYVTYHPHNLNTTLSVSLGQYKFLKTLNSLYFDDKFDLSSFYTINGN